MIESGSFAGADRLPPNGQGRDQDWGIRQTGGWSMASWSRPAGSSGLI